MQQLLTDMCDLVRRHAGDADRIQITPAVSVLIARSVTRPTPTVYAPMLCLVLQGAKHVTIGDRMLRYDPASFFIASLELPVSGQIVEASSEHPYLCATLMLDREELAALIPAVPVQPDGQTAGFGVSPVTQKMLDPWARLLALLEAPEDIPVLAPMLQREILYRLLQGPQGGVLRQIARADSRLSQVRQALHWIRAHFDEAIRVEALAEIAGMSPASFHRHFKAATAMSPLQYQKMLRLQEARRLMVVSASTTQAAYRVGYESASQFSREYARMFGVSPSRDAERMRGERVDLREVNSAA
ncbi:AraC family transcriptional regulator [Mesorhizobium sp. LHD-90]|uniref:AraC family transcriptional regulator n=1 Tax=Mesorhizobium sp. LHD-90 TaxID=3071414 RepID=UPI0027E1E4CE|nr:AraC family transcriptional regulator [Mesorhizobium sp. LHD-90]MDQ6434790.1 AraC family transcriptional regulator [Mesorhizobium sp. LHD-90]